MDNNLGNQVDVIQVSEPDAKGGGQSAPHANPSQVGGASSSLEHAPVMPPVAQDEDRMGEDRVVGPPSDPNVPSEICKLMETQRGQLKLVCGGFAYYKKRENKGGKIIWYCAEGAARCKAGCTTKLGENGVHLLVSSSPHNHLPPVEKLDHEAVKRAAVKRALEQEDTSVSKIVAVSLLGSSPGKRPILGDTGVIRRAALNARAYQKGKAQQGLENADGDEGEGEQEFVYDDPLRLKLPTSITEMEGRRFLLHDSGAGQNRFLVFGTDKTLDILRSDSDVWLADGTFKVAPKPWVQVCSVACM